MANQNATDAQPETETETYTRDGETEYAAVYDLPDDPDATVWLEAVDGDDRVGVDRATFDAEWRPWGYDEELAKVSDQSRNAYDRARQRNGWGVN